MGNSNSQRVLVKACGDGLQSFDRILQGVLEHLSLGDGASCYLSTVPGGDAKTGFLDDYALLRRTGKMDFLAIVFVYHEGDANGGQCLAHMEGLRMPQDESARRAHAELERLGCPQVPIHAVSYRTLTGELYDWKGYDTSGS